MRRLLAEMTWPEIAEAVAAGFTTVVMPLGATEQHGPHLPLGTDTFRAEALAERLAAVLPDAVVAPALPIGCSDEHSGFAGLLSLDHTTLASVIFDCARRMAAWGVRRLVLLSAHGGNRQALELAAARLSAEVRELEVRVLGCSTAIPGALLMLCLRPDLVRMERIVPGHVGSMTEVMPRLLHAGLRSVTPSGVLGEASRADGARGERYLAEQIKSYRQELMTRDVQQCPPSHAEQCP